MNSSIKKTDYRNFTLLYAIYMPQFILLCYFKENSIQEINNLREKHRAYISSKADSISYGGLIKDKEGNGLMIVIHALNKSSADGFVKNDPYFTVYKSYEVKEFEVKISNGSKKAL
jgi:uncharacterized protein YciI